MFFYRRKVMVIRKFWAKKNCWSKREFYKKTIKKILGVKKISEKILLKKIFGEKNFKSKKFLVKKFQTKFVDKKKSGQNSFW